MRLRNSRKHNINISMKCDKYLNNSFLLVESIVLLTLKKSSIKRSLTKIIKFFLRKQFDKNIRTNLRQIFLILILVIFNYSQLTMIYLFHIFVNNQLRYSFLTRWFNLTLHTHFLSSYFLLYLWFLLDKFQFVLWTYHLFEMIYPG